MFWLDSAILAIIITDHLEFRWYVSGELRLSAAVATLNQKKQIKPAEKLKPNEALDELDLIELNPDQHFLPQQPLY